jgi:integrase
MASYTIVKRKKANGDWRYTTSVRVKKNGQFIHRETRTFSKAVAAKEWGRRRVQDIEANGIGGEKEDSATLRELIQLYLNDSHIELGRTKRNVLELVSDCNIAKIKIDELQSKDIVDHCKNRKEAGASASTIGHDVSYIRSVLKSAKALRGYDVDDRCVVDAYPVLHELKLIGKSERRSRRPTSDEIDKLKAGLQKRECSPNSAIPFVDLLEFSILSCMRIGEVCSIRWEDVDEAQKAVLVRDRKDPRKKSGNHMLVPLLGGSWEILQWQERSSDRVFPYNPRSVTAGFQRVRNELKIKDLRYHDLRREGASRLFEKGYSIDEVAQVTGHRNINTLWQVYTELFPKRLHDKD